MNVAFFITPKSEIVTLNSKMTIRQAMEKMSYHKYSAVPVINELGQYIYTLSEGDILWHLKANEHMIFKDTEKQMIKNIKRHRETLAVSVNEDIESLIEYSISQSFVPIVDDQKVFIGIIKRSDLINYCVKGKNFEKLNSAEYVAS